MTGRLPDTTTQIEVAQLLIYRAAWQFGINEPASNIYDMSKTDSAETALDLARSACTYLEYMDMLRGTGYASMMDMIESSGGIDKSLIVD